MSILLTTLLSSLLPVGVEGIKQVIITKLGGVKATTVAEQLQMDDQDIKRLQAIADLDTPIGTPSQWVVDLRASARYVMAGVVIVAGTSGLFLPETNLAVQTMGFEAANIAFGFLFGQRIISNYKK